LGGAGSNDQDKKGQDEDSVAERRCCGDVSGPGSCLLGRKERIAKVGDVREGEGRKGNEVITISVEESPKGTYGSERPLRRNGEAWRSYVRQKKGLALNDRKAIGINQSLISKLRKGLRLNMPKEKSTETNGGKTLEFRHLGGKKLRRKIKSDRRKRLSTLKADPRREKDLGADQEKGSWGRGGSVGGNPGLCFGQEARKN